MSKDQQSQLFDNIAAAMAGVPERIKIHQQAHFYNADPEYGKGVAVKVGIALDALKQWAGMSLETLVAATSEENDHSSNGKAASAKSVIRTGE